MKKSILRWWYFKRAAANFNKSIKWTIYAERDEREGCMHLANMAYQLATIYKKKDLEYRKKLETL